MRDDIIGYLATSSATESEEGVIVLASELPIPFIWGYIYGYWSTVYSAQKRSSQELSAITRTDEHDSIFFETNVSIMGLRSTFMPGSKFRGLILDNMRDEHGNVPDEIGHCSEPCVFHPTLTNAMSMSAYLHGDTERKRDDDFGYWECSDHAFDRAHAEIGGYLHAPLHAWRPAVACFSFAPNQRGMSRWLQFHDKGENNRKVWSSQIYPNSFEVNFAT